MTITLYTIANSPFCQQAREYFSSHGLPFTEKDVEANKDDLNEMLTVSDHFTGVPFTHVILDDGSEAGLRGFTLEEYDHVFTQSTQEMAGVTPLPNQEQPQQAQEVVSTQPQEPMVDNSVPQELPEEDQLESIPTQTDMNTQPPPSEMSTPQPIAAAPTEQVEPEEDDEQEDMSLQQNIDVNQFKAEEVEPSQQLGAVMKDLMQQSNPNSPQPTSNSSYPISNSVQSQPQSEEKPQEVGQQASVGDVSQSQTNPGPAIPDFPNK